jgi:hypothetical protein
MPRTIRNFLCLALLLLVAMPIVRAQDASSEKKTELAGTEKSLSERYDRLELLAGRLAELSKSTQPRRAELLQQLVAKSREKGVPGQFDEIVKSLESDNLGDATKNQTTLQSELQAMLDLLLQEDRDRQIESERQRISKYLAELNKIIRQQRGIKARTAGGDEEQQLGEDQERASDKTGELGSQIEETELNPKLGDEQSEGSESKDNQSKGSPSKSGEPKDDAKPSEDGEKKPGENEPKDPSDQGEPKDGQQSESQDSPSSDSPPSDSQPSDSKPSEGQPSQSKPSQSKPSQSQGQPSEGGQPSESEPQESSEQSQSPSERAVEKLKKAQQRMQQAQERLKQAQRKEAVEEQEAALRELEQAKAELEKILRQLREEEMERLLVLLEARLRKMLEMQNQVYDETKKLDKSAESVPQHELEIASASLSRQEDQIAGEADRALMLLQEDGSSVAFPEALQQAREDMKTVSDRLKRVKTEKVTQALEEDIIATLEETLAALQKALKDLRDKKSQPQQGGGGEPGEQALVDQLAELRMILALQNRVNQRTLFYDEILQGQQADDPELLEALDGLAERQEQIWRATHDLDQGTNQ